MKTIEKKQKKSTDTSAKTKQGRYSSYEAALQAKLERANKTLATTDLSALFKND